MSIFKKASELNNLPSFMNEAYFENHDFSSEDEFSTLFKEASANQSIYEKRKNEFNKLAKTGYEFENPKPAKYAHNQEGIKRSGYGARFSDEKSELFAGQEHLRNIAFDNTRVVESKLKNELSIWDSEFDILQEGFEMGQKQNDIKFERLSAVEKRKIQSQDWENEQLNSIRQSKVLPYRGLGFKRVGNELPVNNGKFGSINDFYAEAQDSVRDMIRTSNRERKTMIERKGFDPEEAKSQWENKESIAARTMESLEKTSFLANFAERISSDVD
jgi:hypothetical protein